MIEGEADKKKGSFTVETLPVPFALKETKDNFYTNSANKPSKEQIINQILKFQGQGKISEAAKYYQYFFDHGFSDPKVFSNYGAILKSLGKLKEAEISTLKAIKLKPDLAYAHSSLGSILSDLGKLKDA